LNGVLKYYFRPSETSSLPLGPTEVSESYYAGGRLGYTTYIAKVWSVEIGVRFYVIITRVLEKSAALAISLKDFLFEELKREGVLRTWMQVKLHSDTGTHFRCNRVMAHAARFWPEGLDYTPSLNGVWSATANQTWTASLA